MRRESRLMLGLAGLVLVAVYYLPLWSIGVVAPQYNDGLGMYIYINDVRGHEQHDIQNLNILNHYIGMKPIEPETVEALTIMPWAVAFLIGLALVGALAGRRGVVWAWLGSFTVLGAAGLLEFYRWLHDYGHNLDPRAPIKVPGMSYQPPLIGREQILNMSASSWPSWGTLVIGISFVLGFLALWCDRRRKTPGNAEPALNGFPPLRAAAMIAALGILAAGCGAERPAQASPPSAADAVTLAGETDAHCGGAVTGDRFGASLTLHDGRTLFFRSSECLAWYLLENGVGDERIEEVMVVEYTNGRRLIDARGARFIRSEQRPSPDGLNILATDSELMSYNLRRFFGGVELTWAEMLEMVRAESSQEAA